MGKKLMKKKRRVRVYLHTVITESDLLGARPDSSTGIVPFPPSGTYIIIGISYNNNNNNITTRAFNYLHGITSLYYTMLGILYMGYNNVIWNISCDVI